MAPLGPVDAAAAVVALGAARLRQIDAESREESLTDGRDFPPPSASTTWRRRRSMSHSGDAQAPRHVVVAHTRFPERRLDAMVRRPAVDGTVATVISPSMARATSAERSR